MGFGFHHPPEGRLGTAPLIFYKWRINMDNDMVDLRPLKKKIKNDYPDGAIIREVILSQADEMPLIEYLIKAKDWFLLVPDSQKA
jgi:hypothetical protein